MPPNQPSPDYNFIMNPQSPRGGGPAFLQNKTNRILALVAFNAVLLIVFIVGFRIISSLGKQNNNDLITLASYQTEIVRIAEEGVENARAGSTKAQAATILAFTTTDLADTKSYLATNGTKVVPERLLSASASTRNEALEEAAQRNGYDEELLSILRELDSGYRTQLQAAINGTTAGTNRAALLNQIADNVEALSGE